MVLLKKEETHMEIYNWSRIRRIRQRIGGRTRRNQANGKPYDLYSSYGSNLGWTEVSVLSSVRPDKSDSTSN